MHEKGSNSTNLRRYNERVVLNAVRQLKEASRAEVARYAHLTPPAVATIMDTLANEGYIRETGRRSGYRGQPSVMYQLTSDRAFSIGVRVGRKALDAMLIDFSGAVLCNHSSEYEYPEPGQVKEIADAAILGFRKHLGAERESRIIGLGLAAPYFIGGWSDELGFPADVASRWENLDLQYLIAAGGVPVHIENDGSAAALAETMHGEGGRDFLCLHLDTFIGGGLVLGGRLHTGVHGNSAAIGPFPVSRSTLNSVTPSPGPFETLVRRASVYVLINHLTARGGAVFRAHELDPVSDALRAPLDEWLDDCAAALAEAATGIVATIDLGAITLGGILPEPVMRDLHARLKARIAALKTPGLVWPELRLSHLGARACALGAASLPLYYMFSPDSSVLIKQKLIKRGPVDLGGTFVE